MSLQKWTLGCHTFSKVVLWVGMFQQKVLENTFSLLGLSGCRERRKRKVSEPSQNGHISVSFLETFTPIEIKEGS